MKKLVYIFLSLSLHSVAQNLTITTTVCSDASSVRMTGPWWGWSINDVPEASNNGDGTWTFNINPAPDTDMEYLLVVDGIMENLVESNLVSENWSCTPVTDQSSYANRLWEVGSGNVSNTYGTCDDCSTLVIYGCIDNAAANYNPLATEDDGSCILPTMLPLTFESGSVEFTDFDGGSSTIIPNPYSSDINSSSNVVEHVRNGGQLWAGTYISVEPIDFSDGSVINMKVYTPSANIPVLLKLEQSSTGLQTEKIMNTSVANEWEVLSYDFGSQPSDLYDRVVIIFNMMGEIGDGSAMSTYYFDDIQFGTGPISGCTDTEAINYNPDAESFADGTCEYTQNTVSVIDVVVNSENHTILEAAVVAAGLVEPLSGDGPFTVFAPTDAAFALLPEGLIAQLLEDPTGDLTTILTHHFHSGNVLSTDLLSDGMMVPTLAGTELTVSLMNGMVQIDNANVSVADIETDNGVIHVIDVVLDPDNSNYGCTDANADNFDPAATYDNGSCEYENTCEFDLSTITTFSGEYDQEISLSIISGADELVFAFSQGYPNYQGFGISNIIENAPTYNAGTFDVCLDPQQCYTIYMTDYYGDGWNGASFSLNDQIFSLPSGSEISYNYGDACEEETCDNNLFSYELSQNNNFGVSIIDFNSNETLYSVGGGASGEFCLNSEGCYILQLSNATGVSDTNYVDYVTIENQQFYFNQGEIVGGGAYSQFNPYLTTFSDIFGIGCIISGCTDPISDNFNEMAVVNDGSCQQYEIGCMNSIAINYNPAALGDDGSCEYHVIGCTDPAALNFDPAATFDNGLCIRQFPITFENDTVNHYWPWDFNNTISYVVTNPDPDDINSSSNVLQHGWLGPQNYNWQGTLMQVEPINFSINGSVFTLDVYTSNINTPVLLKLESPEGGEFIEQLQFTSTSNNWEQLTYDFGDSLTDNLYTKVVLFFEFAPENYGTQIETSTFYVDNIDQLNSQEVLINHLENEIAALQSELNSCSASEVTTENIPLDLPQGWSMFGYTCINSVDVVEAFNEINDKILLVKDEIGAVYLPEWNFNAIGDLTFSEGYQIKMLETLTDFQFCPTFVPIVQGCMDETASNFNPDANVDNGSCQYCYYLSDNEFVDWLQVSVPEVINENCLDTIAAVEFNGSLNIEETLISNLDGIQYFTNLTALSIHLNDSLTNIPTLSSLTNMSELSIYLNENLTTLPNFGWLPNLTDLIIEANYNLTSIPGLEGLTNLSYLRIQSNHGLTILPNIFNSNYLIIQNNSGLTNLDLSGVGDLEYLNIHGNQGLLNISDLSQSISLTELEISYNNSLTSVPDLSGLTSLNDLAIFDNENLECVEGYPEQLSIEENWPTVCPF